MKKFTSLLVALLSIGSIICQLDTCAADATAHSMLQRLDTYQTGIAGTTAANPGVCGVAAADVFCCDVTKFKNAVTTELTKVKEAFINFGSKVKDFNAAWAKVVSLLTNAKFSSLSAAERSGVDASILETWAIYYNSTQIDADFAAFKGQVVDCYAAYAKAVRKVACNACAAQEGGYTVPSHFGSSTISITAASCSNLVDKCGKVWTFAHKFGWLVQITAAINKKKDPTFSWTAPTLGAIYAPGSSDSNAGVSVIFREIEGAIVKCGPSVSTTCDAANKAFLCRAFFSIWPGAAATTPRIGRAQTAQLAAGTASAGKRLLIAASIGSIKVADSTNDITTDAAVPLATDVPALTAADISEWTVGFPASPSSVSSSSSAVYSSSSNAKILLGTLLNFVAISLLN